jgi:hypothetical protein
VLADQPSQQPLTAHNMATTTTTTINRPVSKPRPLSTLSATSSAHGALAGHRHGLSRSKHLLGWTAGTLAVAAVTTWMVRNLSFHIGPQIHPTLETFSSIYMSLLCVMYRVPRHHYSLPHLPQTNTTCSLSRSQTRAARSRNPSPSKKLRGRFEELSAGTRID